MNKENVLLSLILSLFLFTISITLAYSGAMMNDIAVRSNSCKMPVLSNFDFETDTHFTYQEFSQVNNSKFTDIYHIKDTTYSLGDFLIYGGIGISYISIFFIILFTTYYGVLVYKERSLIKRTTKP